VAEKPEEELARSLLVALRADFAERKATALELAELLLDAIAAALPLTRNEPAEPALVQLESLATQGDVYSWDGAPGWDVVLARGLQARAPIEAGPSVLDALGAQAERDRQRAELERRAREQAVQLVSLGREAARFAAARGASAEVLDQVPTLPAASALVAAHASLFRLIGLAAASSPLLLPEDPRAFALPPPGEKALEEEMDRRDLDHAQEEWLALLLARNPAAAQAPAFRTFYAGLSQALRVATALRRFRDEARSGRLASDGEALLGAVGGWQPVRWSSLRGGAPAQWIAQLCPPAPSSESDLERLARECSAGLDLVGRLWLAENLSLTGFTTLAALLIGRCASAVALWEELGGGSSS